jgi:plasmid stabilization system protein ParE
MTPVFHPAAAQELAAAAEAYESRAPRLGQELIIEARRLIALICAHPQIGKPLDKVHRRMPMRRFPLLLVYRVDSDLVRVIAVAHRRRRPGYWRQRS